MDMRPSDPAKIADGDLAFFTTWAPLGTTIERLAKIEGHRWAIEGSFKTAKTAARGGTSARIRHRPRNIARQGRGVGCATFLPARS
jgi:hypothetical protein